MQKTPIFKQKNLQKSMVKFFYFIEAEFTTHAKHNSQNMPKCIPVVFFLHAEERGRLKSHSFSQLPDFIDL